MLGGKSRKIKRVEESPRRKVKPRPLRLWASPLARLGRDNIYIYIYIYIYTEREREKN